jgi:hypothetical protein
VVLPYCIAMMKHYEAINTRRANFSFAVGTPERDMWLYLIPAIRHAHAYGHYIALHEYTGFEADYGVGWKQIDANRRPTTDVWHGRPDKGYPWGWTVLRYRYIWDTVLKPAGLEDTKLLITETGCDSVPSVTPLGMPTGTWREMEAAWQADGRDPYRHYANMLLWYDEHLKQDHYVAGATVFTVGSTTTWRNWDIAGTPVEDHLLAAIEADQPKPPDPEPPMTYKAIVVKAPQVRTPEEFRRICEEADKYRHDIISSHDTMREVLIASGDPTSYVKIAFPERQAEDIKVVVDAGFAWVSLFPQTVSDPLSGLELGHLFAYRYILTSPFNAVRSYGNKLHEGLTSTSSAAQRTIRWGSWQPIRESSIAPKSEPAATAPTCA